MDARVRELFNQQFTQEIFENYARDLSAQMPLKTDAEPGARLGSGAGFFHEPGGFAEGSFPLGGTGRRP